MNEREAKRQAIRDEAVRRANQVGRSIRCATSMYGTEIAQHNLCRGEDLIHGAGCLCECHDPEDAT